MKWLSFMSAVLWVAIALPVNAEFYRFRDQKGAIRFTDNLSEVPLDQRPHLDRYREPDDSLTAAEKEKKAREKQAAAVADPIKATEEKPAEAQAEAPEGQDAIVSVEALSAQSAEMFKQYEALNREREALKQAGGLVKNQAHSRVHNQKVMDFNQRFEAYQKKQEVFQKQVEAFNARQAQPTGGNPTPK